MTTKKKSRLLDKLPTHFDIGWAKFEFKFKKDLVDDEGAKCFGITDIDDYTITLENSMADNVAHPTIIHEVCHVLMDSLGLGGPEDGEPDKVETTNEILTESVARAFLLFKYLNPELWHTLFEEYYE